jgi:hypothetical protein
MPPKPALNEAGLQPWKGGALEPKAILNSLVGKHGKALSCERNLEAIISEDSGACVLRCRGCDGEFSATNPHYVMQTHVAACKAPLRTSPRDQGVHQCMDRRGRWIEAWQAHGIENLQL